MDAHAVRPRPHQETFRYLPGFLLMTVLLGGFFVIGGVMGVRDAVQDGWLMSAKGVLVLVIVIGGNLFSWLAIMEIWRLHWRFTFTPSHLVATHRLRRYRLDIPWEEIVAVRKCPRAWWARGGGGLSVSRIETASGQQVEFMTHLMLRYDRFLSELRTRAINHKVFDPYVDEWE